METAAMSTQPSAIKKRNLVLSRLKRDRWLYLLLVPGVLYFLIFKYWPMWGVLIAFQDYHPAAGFRGSDWVGVKHFIRFFNESSFWILLRNTAILGVYNLLIFFPMPIIIALLLNELRI